QRAIPTRRSSDLLQKRDKFSKTKVIHNPLKRPCGLSRETFFGKVVLWRVTVKVKPNTTAILTITRIFYGRISNCIRQHFQPTILKRDRKFCMILLHCAVARQKGGWMLV